MFRPRNGLLLPVLLTAAFAAEAGAQQQAPATPQLLRVEVSRPAAMGSGIAVVLACGRRVELAKSFDAATLAQAVSVLERL